FGGDLTFAGEAGAEDGGALELGARGLGVHDEACIDGGVDTWNVDLAVGRDFDLNHRRNVGKEAAVNGNAEAGAMAELAFAPSRLFGNEFDNPAVACDVDGVIVERAVVVWIVGRGFLDVELACFSEESELVIDRIALGNVSELVSERLYGERVVDI